MRDEFINKLDMFSRCLGVLDTAENKPVWENQPPVILTTKVGDARTMVAALRGAQQEQEENRTGAATEKDREETELEDAADALASALAIYFKDHQRETEAAEVALTLSDWRKLRDQQLLARSQTVVDHAEALVAGSDAQGAAGYGITAAAVLALKKERQDYADIVNAPDVAIAIRKALTQGFRPAFNLTDAKFAEMDKLLLQLRSTPAGRTLLAEWRAARNIKGPGSGGSGGGGGTGGGGNPPQG